jgi:hypothetical protein
MLPLQPRATWSMVREAEPRLHFSVTSNGADKTSRGARAIYFHNAAPPRRVRVNASHIACMIPELMLGPKSAGQNAARCVAYCCFHA